MRKDKYFAVVRKSDNDIIIVFLDKKSAEDFVNSGKFRGKLNSKKEYIVKEYLTRKLFSFDMIFESLDSYNEVVASLKSLSSNQRFIIKNHSNFSTSHSDEFLQVLSTPIESDVKIGDKLFAKNGGYDVGGCTSLFRYHFNIEGYKTRDYCRDWQQQEYTVNGFAMYGDKEIYYLVGDKGCQLVCSYSDLFIGDRGSFEYSLKYAEGTNIRDVKKEHIEELYSVDVGGCVGITNLLTSTIYKYVPKQFTKSGRNIYLGYEQCFDGGKKAREKGAYTFDSIKRHIESGAELILIQEGRLG